MNPKIIRIVQQLSLGAVVSLRDLDNKNSWSSKSLIDYSGGRLIKDRVTVVGFCNDITTSQPSYVHILDSEGFKWVVLVKIEDVIIIS